MSFSNSEDKDIQYAYCSIHDFFDHYHFSAAIKETERIIKTAARPKYWTREYAYRPIYFMQQLQELVTAAFSIGKSYSPRHVCIVTGTNLQQTKHFVGSNQGSDAWNNMPRHLTAAQYQNPYLVIEKFTGYATEAEWKQVCLDLAEYALSNSSIDDQYPCYKLLPVRLHILRLIEACHLLEVRSRDAGKKELVKKQKSKMK